MKNNNMRIILCLFMCCALLFTCVARPASATSVAVVAGLAAIPVAVAVASAFQALGVMSASNSTDFTTTVDSCSNWLTENSSFVVNGAVSLLGLTNAGVTTSYLQKSFVQTVWEWIFSNKAVNYDAPVISSSFSIGSTNYSFSASQPMELALFWRTGSSYYAGYVPVAYCLKSSLVSATVYVDGSSKGGSYYGDYYVVQLRGDVTGSIYNDNFYPTTSLRVIHNTKGYNNWNSVFNDYFVKSTPSSYYSGLDLQLGQIQSPYQDVGTEEETIQIEIAPIYIDWTKYGVPDPNDPGGDDPDNDGKFPMWLPTGIPSPGYDDSVITQNQQQAQSGVVSGDITFEPYEPDDPGSGGGGAGSGTDLSSVIQAIINVPTVIVSGIGDFISDFFGFNGNYEDYMVQLRDFFPFCIPFDLYDFITVLSAEPEAPVFHWEIPVPQLGQTFELEVDLSAWDDIAVLFRNLELLAFIFGLAIMTREKFLRS